MGNKNLLFEIADHQQGFFTSQQAESCGYHRGHFHRYIDSGEWIKELRGIYRLALYPITDRPELVLWSLWSRDRKDAILGVWSHETALDIYELSDVMPAKMHMTVPTTFRKGVTIPKLLVLHYFDLKESEIRHQQGYRVTTPIRTLIDIVVERRLSDELITQAFRDALKTGLVSRHELNTHTELKEFVDEYKI